MLCINQLEMNVFTLVKRLFPALLVSLFLLPGVAALAEPENKVGRDVRCSVCGMFVAKYDDWIVQLRMADNTVMFFDGVKDMMVFYHAPDKFSSFAREDIREVWVKDYYTLKWLDGMKARYVIGSDVYGPMGKEFIPFASRAAAENFMKDHHGEKIIPFNEITDELVQSMRTKMKMRHGSK